MAKDQTLADRAPTPGEPAATTPKNTLTITDNRTGRAYEVPIEHGTIRATDLRQIRTTPDDFGLMSYDPAFMNTASCKSAVTFIDGDRGILQYRGYPIEELAEKSTFLETAYLIIHGELPTRVQFEDWKLQIAEHYILHENIKRFIGGFHHDAHPMGMLVSTAGALSTFYPDAKNIADPVVRKRQIHRLLGKMPTLAAFAYRHSRGLPYEYAPPGLSFAATFMAMLWQRSGARTAYAPDPVVERALDLLFILHADHEQNCSASAMRVVGSSHPDPYCAVAAATGALYGPLHGGANEEVLRMLREIGTKDRVPGYIERVKAGEMRLMGFGHRIYKNYDPRARIIKEAAHKVFAVTGTNPLLDIALELERIALQDEYFVGRKLYPNVDFYSGLIYEALGFPAEMFPVLFAIPRTAGWIAQWQEMLLDKEQKIARPRQVFVGSPQRAYVPVEKR
jgi:citrate synthase